MRRSALALGAIACAFALTAGPARAAPNPIQAVDDAALSAQVGSVAVDAPVRVGSHGDNAAPAGPSDGNQTVTDSAGTAQVGSVGVSAPVRVASDGENAGSHAAGGSGGGAQSTDDSLGSGQGGSVGVNAPVRVASDGDNGAPAAPSGGTQTVTDSVGTAQVGSVEVNAPVRVASDGENAGSAPAGAGGGGPQSTDDSLGSAQVGSMAADAPVRVASDGDDGSPAGNAVPPATESAQPPAASPDGGEGATPVQVLEPNEQGEPDEPGGVERGDRADAGGGQPGEEVAGTTGIQTLAAQAGTLPLTGLALLATVGLGVLLLCAGLAVRPPAPSR